MNQGYLREKKRERKRRYMTRLIPFYHSCSNFPHLASLVYVVWVGNDDD
jgi:hypothetical protein